MKKLIYSLLSLLAFSTASAQCGTDAYNYELVKDKLTEGEDYTDYIERNFEYHRGEVVHQKKASRIIPVVFHIVHAYGEENISKEQIEDQMRIINEDFQRTNADASKTRDIFKSRAANLDIEFKLARIAPDGSCTEGITRTYDPVNTIEDRTDSDQEVKTAVPIWDRNKYMNVWVVKDIESGVTGSRILGYAQFPGNNSQTDGIVVVHDHIGSIGTSSLANAGRTLTHEIGHWLGLYHPFQGTRGSSGCFGSGDRVDDTPPVAESSFGCTSGQNPNTCNTDSPDEVDNVENFMDYNNGNCMNMFTEGQKTRAYNYLASTSVQGRGLVVSATNLLATGVNTTPTCAPIADFWYGPNQELTTICAGQTMTFEGLSYNGEVTSRTWTFEGGTPSTSSEENPTITFNQPGIYEVKLQVSNSSGTDEISRSKFVTVLPAEADNKAPFGTDFTEDVDDWDLEYSDGTGWAKNNARGYSDDASLEMIINENSPRATRFRAIMPPVDIAALGEGAELHFKYAYARRATTSTEVLQVLISDDCGDNWRSLGGFNGNNLTTSDVSPGWRPSTSSDWDAKVISLAGYIESNNAQIRFDVISNSGNSVFIDDINIGFNALSTPSFRRDIGLKISPNPATNSITLRMNENINRGVVSIVDITGRLLLQQNLEASNQTISTASLANGVYSVVVQSEGSNWSKKLIISK